MKRLRKLCFECEAAPVRARLSPFCSQRCAAEFGLAKANDGELECAVSWCLVHGWFWPSQSARGGCMDCDTEPCRYCGHAHSLHRTEGYESLPGGCLSCHPIECECPAFEGPPRGDLD